MPDGLRDLLVGNWWRYAVSTLGALLLAVSVGSALIDGRLTSEELQQLSLLVVVCLGLIAFGARIAVEVRGRNEIFRILGWVSVGVLVLAAVGGWFQAVAVTASTEFEMALLFLSLLATGGLFGALVGYYDVRVRALVERASREEARRAYLDEQQQTLTSLNGILRHQILNDLSAISGRAELLEADQIDTRTATDSIIDHCDHMVATVERIETVVDVLTWVTDRSDTSVSKAVANARANALEQYPELTVATDGLTDVTVTADELLYLALAELFENVAAHTGSDATVSVSVIVTVDTAIIEITDDGPGIAADSPELLFEPNTRGRDSEGDGLGLFLAELIIERYNGDIRFVENGAGATVEVELPLADS